MAYIILLVVLAIWAFFALRDRPLWEYAAIFSVAEICSNLAEFTWSGIFRLYSYRSYFIADAFHDERLMAVFITLGIDPLICVLHARYCRKNPVLMAFVSAVIIGTLETIFVWVGAMGHPHGWRTMYSVWASIPAFLFISALAVGWIRIPPWLHLLGIAFWAAFLQDVLFDGALWWYHYQFPFSVTGNPLKDSRLAALAYNGLVQTPLAVVAAMAPRRWRMPLLGAFFLLFMGIEVAGLHTGLTIYRYWNLGGAALNYAFTLVVPMLYARWLERTDSSKQPGNVEPWQPPV